MKGTQYFGKAPTETLLPSSKLDQGGIEMVSVFEHQLEQWNGEKPRPAKLGELGNSLLVVNTEWFGWE